MSTTTTLARTLTAAAMLVALLAPANAQLPTRLAEELLGLSAEMLADGIGMTSNGRPDSSAAAEAPLSRSELRAVQERLNERGYDAGRPDGVMGRRTRTAIAAYQRAIGAPADGTLSAAQRGMLFAAPAATVPAGFELLFDTDLPGNDFRSGMESASLRDITLDACQTACSGDGRCAAFTYNANARVCFLKTEGSDRSPFRNAISGIRVDAGTAVAQAEVPEEAGIDALSTGSAASTIGTPQERELVAAQAGLSGVAPILAGDRLLAGFPLMHGELARESEEFWGRERPLAQANLALYLDLAVLKHNPRVLEDPVVARRYAERFLNDTAADAYIQRCDLQCNDTPPFDGWVGGTEFEREESYERFLAEVAPQLATSVPDGPLRMVHVTEVELRPYDDGASAFPLRARRPAFTIEPAVDLAAGRIHTDSEPELPGALPVARDAAPGMLERFEDRFGYLAVDVDVELTGEERYGRPVAALSFGAMRLFADPDLAVEVADLTPAEPEAAGVPQPIEAGDLAAISGGVLPIVGDRLLVRASETFPELLPGEAADRLGALAAALVAANHPDVFEDDDTAFAMLAFAPAPLQAQMLREAGMDPDEVRIERLPRGLDEFDRHALLRVIREQLPAILAAGAPPLPVPFLAVCRLGFGEYDFDREVFPARGDQCDALPTTRYGNGDLTTGNIRITAPLAIEELPREIAVPLAEARDYRNRNLDANPVYGIEGRIVGLREAASDGRRREFELVIENEGVALYAQDDLGVPLDRLALRETPSAATVATEPVGAVWLSDSETLDLLALAEGVTDPGSVDFAAWAEHRAGIERQDGPLSWARFFPPETVRDISNGRREVGTELLANFAEWTRLRAEALPATLRLRDGRSGDLDRLADDDGAIRPFAAGRSGDDQLRRLALRAGTAERLTADIRSDWMSEGAELIGPGKVRVALELRADRSTYALPVDVTGADADTSVELFTELQVSGLRLVAAEGEELPVLVVTAAPVEMRAVARDGRVVAARTFDVPEAEVPMAVTPVSFPPPGWYPQAFAQLQGTEPMDVLEQWLQCFGDEADAFTRRAAAVELAGAAREWSGEDGIWVLGRLEVDDYHFDRGGFGVDSLRIFVHEDPDDPYGYLADRANLSLNADADELLIEMAPDVAQEWLRSNPSHPDYDIRVRVQLEGLSEEPAEWNSCTGNRPAILVRPLEIQLIDRGANLTVNDPSVIRHVIAVTAPSPE